MLDLGFLLILTVVSAGVGLRVLAKLGGAPSHPADALALALPLGLGLLALATLGLAEVGWLTETGLFGLLAVAALFLPRPREIQRWRVSPALQRDMLDDDIYLHTSSSSATSETVRFGGISSGWIDLAMAIGVVGTLLTAMGPVTDGDALCYHLQVPKIFLERHAASFEPDLHETVYPLGVEMLYAVALAFRGPVACRLVQWAFGLIFAANVTALARPSIGDRARWAGAIAMLAPAISNGMGAPLNDVALAAFGNAALFAWARWAGRPSKGLAAVAGMLAGMAAGVKYPGLVWAGLLGAWMVALRPRRLGDAMTFGAVAIAAGGCWYLRAYVHTGNPVYPFFRHAFGGAGIDDVLDPIKRPLALSAWNLATALGPLTLQPDRFDSLSHQFGPAFLLFLPGVFLLRPSKHVLSIIAVGMAFLTACLCVRQSMRFVLIAVGPMAVGVAWAASTWADRRSLPGRAIVAALTLILLGESALALARARHGIGVVLGRESAEAFLLRREPTFRVGRWIGEHLPESARLIGQDHRGFYLPRPYAMELAHRRRTGLGTRGESAGEIVDHLRREGFSHLLLCPPEPETAVEFDPTLGRKLARWLEARRPLYQEAIADADGVVRRYSIYALAESPTREARR